MGKNRKSNGAAEDNKQQLGSIVDYEEKIEKISNNEARKGKGREGEGGGN